MTAVYEKVKILHRFQCPKIIIRCLRLLQRHTSIGLNILFISTLYNNCKIFYCRYLYLVNVIAECEKSSRCAIVLVLRHSLYSLFLSSFDWRVSQYSAMQKKINVPHGTGRADFQHPALQQDSHNRRQCI